MKKSILLSAVMALAYASAHAENPPTSPFTANLSLTSNYKFRGQDQGNNKPALQGGFDYAKDGFYIGNWNSSIGFTDAGIEMDLYAGYKGVVSEALGYDLGILQYYYPQKDRQVDFNTTELYGALSSGPATLKYSHTVSKDYFGFGGGVARGRNTGYLDLAINYEIVPSLTFNGRVGYTRFSSDLRDSVDVPNYYDYKVGVTYDLSKFVGSGVSISGAIVGASEKGFYGDVNKARFIATLTKAL